MPVLNTSLTFLEEASTQLQYYAFSFFFSTDCQLHVLFWRISCWSSGTETIFIFSTFLSGAYICIGGTIMGLKHDRRRG